MGFTFSRLKLHASRLIREAIIEQCVFEVPFPLAAHLTAYDFKREAKIAHAFKT